MKLLNIQVNYNEDTRALTTNVTMDGFVPELPSEQIIAQQTDTITLLQSPVLMSVDTQAVAVSVSRALLTANAQLVEWQKARDSKAKADMLPDPPVPEP